VEKLLGHAAVRGVEYLIIFDAPLITVLAALIALFFRSDEFQMASVTWHRVIARQKQDITRQQSEMHEKGCTIQRLEDEIMDACGTSKRSLAAKSHNIRTHDDQLLANERTVSYFTDRSQLAYARAM
jgi:hypothetical protein